MKAVAGRIQAGIWVGILVLLFSVGGGSLYAAVKSRDVDILRVAFMNGYLEALKLDEEQIKKLKKDESLLQEKVEKAADQYIGVLHGMNR